VEAAKALADYQRLTAEGNNSTQMTPGAATAQANGEKQAMTTVLALVTPKRGVALGRRYCGSRILMTTLVLMTMQLSRANGGHLPQQAPKSLPPGVLGLDGWANRLLVLLYCLWVFVAAWHAIKLHRKHLQPNKVI
jgi:hypothetical protein